MTHMIELDKALNSRMKMAGMNWACSLQKPYEFRPTSFTSKVDGLKPRVFSRAKQEKMMGSFLRRPERPVCFGIASAPNDGQSLLLGAWMMEQHLRIPGSRPVWHDLTGGFDCKLLQESEFDSRPTLIVLNNVGPDSSGTKKEKLRDILVTYSDVPRIVIVNGSDPFLFLTLHMRMKLQGLSYITNSSIQRIVAV